MRYLEIVRAHALVVRLCVAFFAVVICVGMVGCSAFRREDEWDVRYVIESDIHESDRSTAQPDTDIEQDIDQGVWYDNDTDVVHAGAPDILLPQVQLPRINIVDLWNTSYINAIIDIVGAPLEITTETVGEYVRGGFVEYMNQYIFPQGLTVSTYIVEGRYIPWATHIDIDFTIDDNVTQYHLHGIDYAFTLADLIVELGQPGFVHNWEENGVAFDGYFYDFYETLGAIFRFPRGAGDNAIIQGLSFFSTL